MVSPGTRAVQVASGVHSGLLEPLLPDVAAHLQYFTFLPAGMENQRFSSPQELTAGSGRHDYLATCFRAQKAGRR